MFEDEEDLDESTSEAVLVPEKDTAVGALPPYSGVPACLRSRGTTTGRTFEVFRTLECVIDRLCETIRSLTCEMVRSITSRQWIVNAFLEQD